MSFLQSAKIAVSQIEKTRGRRSTLLSFGVNYLDDSLDGILPNDLILIGAGSGAGKTELCCSIARHNVERGKRVHYLALEAEYGEIENRILYQMISNNFYNDVDRPRNVKLYYNKWLLGDYGNDIEKYEGEAASEFMRKFTSLFTFYKDKDFNSESLINSVMFAADETDLVILDHVHYMDWDDANENLALKSIAKTARDLSLSFGKPIILVSHLRKRDKWQDEMCPGLEEFHGSSDLYKIATKAFTIAAGNYIGSGKYETYFRIVKNRISGSVTRFMGKSIYKPSEGRYENSYEIGKSNQKRGDDFECINESERPDWAKHSDSSKNLLTSNSSVPRQPSLF